jgi:hypothetical protein
MGRGRQKAKQTKVARELKYFSPATNYDALEAELRRSSPSDAATTDDDDSDNTDFDDYAAWAEETAERD